MDLREFYCHGEPLNGQTVSADIMTRDYYVVLTDETGNRAKHRYARAGTLHYTYSFAYIGEVK